LVVDAWLENGDVPKIFTIERHRRPALARQAGLDQLAAERWRTPRHS
jgi:hypothetical protein